jgi:hypothetical protein
LGHIYAYVPVLDPDRVLASVGAGIISVLGYGVHHVSLFGDTSHLHSIDRVPHHAQIYHDTTLPHNNTDVGYNNRVSNSPVVPYRATDTRQGYPLISIVLALIF